jgi:hypothetical protein
VSWSPFRNTGQGVYSRGEVKHFSMRSCSEGEKLATRKRQELRLKGREVTGIRPESARSSLGQGEAQRKLRGGPKPMLAFELLG